MSLLRDPRTWPMAIKITAIALILAFVPIAWWWRQRQSANTSTTLQTAVVKSGTLTKTLSLSGTVQQTHISPVTTQATGVVKSVQVRDGEVVREGALIAEIALDQAGKSAQAQAWNTYLQAKNALETAKTKQLTLESSMWKAHETFESKALDGGLAETDPVFIETQREWLAAEADYKNQAQAITAAQANVTQTWQNYQLYRATLTAPVAGTIVGLSIAPGLSVGNSSSSTSENSSGTPVAQIQSAGKPLALFTVTEVDIAQVQTNQAATLQLDSIPGTAFSGSVVAIDRVGTVSSGVTQYSILVALESNDVALLPNMAITGEIILAQKENVLIVPSSAITTGRNGQSSVRVQRDGRTQLVEVELGLETDTEVEVISGVNDGETVVTSTTGSAANTTSSNRQNTGFMPTGGAQGREGGAAPAMMMIAH